MSLNLCNANFLQYIIDCLRSMLNGRMKGWLRYSDTNFCSEKPIAHYKYGFLIDLQIYPHNIEKVFEDLLF